MSHASQSGSPPGRCSPRSWAPGPGCSRPTPAWPSTSRPGSASVAEPGTILVDDSNLGGLVALPPAGGSAAAARVKGAPTPVVVHEVAGWRRSAPRLASAALPLLVGGCASSTASSSCSTGWRRGGEACSRSRAQPGIGKTRVRPGSGRAGAHPRVRPGLSDVADHPRGHPVGFWRDVVGGLLGVRRNAPRRDWLDALASALPDVPGQRGDPRAAARAGRRRARSAGRLPTPATWLPSSPRPRSAGCSARRHAAAP